MISGDHAAHQAAGHLPVLYSQVIAALQVKPDGCYLDGTFGRGGHAQGVLALLGPQGRLLVMDKDPDAIAVAQTLRDADSRVSVYHGSFADMDQWDAARNGVDGILLDLGVSSPQLDVAERERSPLTRTAQLASLIASVMPRGDSKIHPATRSFQAIRIYINSELDDLTRGLRAAVSVLKPQGRLAVISFHSLEDRIAKQFFNSLAKAPPTDRRMPVAVEFTPTLRLIGGAAKGTADEIAMNPRARSAVLRVAEKVAA